MSELNVSVEKNSEEIIKNLSKGAFLITKNEEKLNVMSIAWGTIGINWYKPVFVIMIRGARYTKDIIDKSMEFTLTIPTNDDMTKEIEYCGTKSGRDTNKFKDLSLTTCPPKINQTPSIVCKSIVIECKVIYKQFMDKDSLDQSCTYLYEENIYHTFYHGEILDIQKK